MGRPRRPIEAPQGKIEGDEMGTVDQSEVASVRRDTVEYAPRGDEGYGEQEREESDEC